MWVTARFTGRTLAGDGRGRDLFPLFRVAVLREAAMAERFNPGSRPRAPVRKLWVHHVVAGPLCFAALWWAGTGSLPRGRQRTVSMKRADLRVSRRSARTARRRHGLTAGLASVVVSVLPPGQRAAPRPGLC